MFILIANMLLRNACCAARSTVIVLIWRLPAMVHFTPSHTPAYVLLACASVDWRPLHWVRYRCLGTDAVWSVAGVAQKFVWQPHVRTNMHMGTVDTVALVCACLAEFQE